MEKLQRIFKPMFEEMLERGLLERRSRNVEGEIDLETLLDCLDARILAYGGASAEDLAEMILQGLNIEFDQPEVIEAYVVGFRGGQVAARSGADLMDLGGHLSEASAVGIRAARERQEQRAEA